MSITTIPAIELAKHLNQMDLRNLLLTNKETNAIFKSHQEKIKALIDGKTNHLRISLLTETNKEKTGIITKFSYSFESKHNTILSGKIKFEFSFYTIVYQHTKSKQLEEFLMAIKIPLKSGDIIQYQSPINVMSYEVTDKTLCSYNTFDFEYNGFNINILSSISLGNHSPFHWDWVLDDVFLTFPVSRLHYSTKCIPFIEIDMDEFLFRLRCVKNIQVKIALPYKDVCIKVNKKRFVEVILFI